MEIKLCGEPAEIAAFIKGLEREAQKIVKKTVITKVDGTRPQKKKPKIVPFSKHRRQKSWTAQEDKYVLKMVKQGRKHRLIGKDIGRTTAAVRVRHYKLIHQGVKA